VDAAYFVYRLLQGQAKPVKYLKSHQNQAIDYCIVCAAKTTGLPKTG